MLKDVLMEWKKEVEKKPPEMSVDQAYENLGLAVGVGGHEESKVRKAYFKMAQKYHVINQIYDQHTCTCTYTYIHVSAKELVNWETVDKQNQSLTSQLL